MTLKLITAPASEPVTLEQAKLQRRVEHTLDDDWFSTIAIPSARRAAEHITGLALVTQTWELVLDAFPAGAIALGKPPVQSITSIKYQDADGVEQTLDPSLYALDADTAPGFVLLARDASWPSSYSEANAVRIRFVAGFGDASSVPATVKQWMLVQIATAHRFKERFVAGVGLADLPNRFVDGLLDEVKAYL